MGQAVADLPNPLDASPPASLSGTDDLLAQLAGDEIDRLLAEADVERAAPAAATSSAPATTTADPATATLESLTPPPVAPLPPPKTTPGPPQGDELDKLLSELNKDASPAVVGEAADKRPAASAKPRTLTEQVPDVLAQLAVGPPMTLGESAAGPTPAAAAAPPAPRTESVDSVMTAAEREALSLSNLEAATAAAEQQDASAAAAAAAAAEKAVVQAATSASADVSSSPVHVHFAVRVLEWINAPLSFIPDAVRDPIGKAAIVTIVNSIAVLIYVLFVRH